jgi:hypothetical protein
MGGDTEPLSSKSAYSDTMVLVFFGIARFRVHSLPIQIENVKPRLTRSLARLLYNATLLLAGSWILPRHVNDQHLEV